MFDFNARPGAIKEWRDRNGNLQCVLRCFKKRRKRGRRTSTSTVIRILTPDEYKAEKLTRSGKTR